MRIRMLRQIATATSCYDVGKTYEVPDKQGKEWCKVGVAMEDKSEDGPKETKMTRTKTSDGGSEE